MLPTGHLLAFALLSFVLIIVPGPNVARRRGGRKNADLCVA